jgi:hypothetical protein
MRRALASALLGLTFALTLAACGSSSNAPAENTIYGSCSNVDASAICANPDASSFEAQVQPILARSCLPMCHDGTPDAAWPLVDYDDVSGWTTFIADDLLHCTMPPLDKAESYPITRQDRETILQWIVCGAKP